MPKELDEPATRKDLMSLMDIMSDGFTAVHNELVVMRKDINIISEKVVVIEAKMFEHGMRLSRIETYLGIDVVST